LVAILGVGEKGQLARFGEEQSSTLLNDDISVAVKLGAKMARKCCQCHTHPVSLLGPAVDVKGSVRGGTIGD
jgi:hypothetical protein